MGKVSAGVDWKVVGLEQTINQIRNIALSFLFVEIAQTRAMRSAGTLASAMLQVESAFIRAHFSALQWGQTTLDAVAKSEAFRAAEENVEKLELELGKLRSAWIVATRDFGFISPQALQARVRLEQFVVLHPALEEQTQMLEQTKLQRVGILQTQLHLAVSQMMLRQNIKIAEIAERLLEVQLIQSSVLIGAALGGGVGPTAAIGAAIGLGVGGALAISSAAAFSDQRNQMLSTADTLFDLSNRVLDMSGSAEDLNTTFKDLNDEIKDLITTFRDFGTSVKPTIERERRGGALEGLHRG